jgi:hypothetical protein
MPNRVRKSATGGPRKVIWDLNYALYFVLDLIEALPEDLATPYKIIYAAIKLELPLEFPSYMMKPRSANSNRLQLNDEQLTHIIEKFGYRFTLEHMYPQNMSPFDIRLFKTIRRRWNGSINGFFDDGPDEHQLRLVANKDKK